jgi:glutaredoxin 3
MGISQPTNQQTLNKPPHIKMYSTRFCPYCTRARALFKKKGVSYEDIDVGSTPKLWRAMEAVSGRTTVPQIFIGSLHVGGYDDMAALERAGKLDALLFNQNLSQGVCS